MFMYAYFIMARPRAARTLIITELYMITQVCNSFLRRIDIFSNLIE